MSQRNDAPPAKAENDAWYAYKYMAAKQGREVDERTFRDGWRQGAHFTFTATSMLSPAIAAFIGWMEYITDHTPLSGDSVPQAAVPQEQRS